VNLQKLRRAMKNPGETFIVAMGALFGFKDSTCDVFMSHSKKLFFVSRTRLLAAPNE